MDEQLAFDDRLVRLMFGGMAMHVVGLAARWRLADALRDGERSASDLAHQVGTPEWTTVRVLRAAASLDLLNESRPGWFRLTDLGAQLRTDHPWSLYSIVRMVTDPVFTSAWGSVDDCVRTGLPAFDKVYGTGFFSYLQDKPELSARYDAALGQGTRETASALLRDYDFSRFDTVMDIGGRNGILLSAILREHPALRGVLFDTAEGVARAAEVLDKAGVAGRCEIQAGDFFSGVPHGADLHILKNVAADWPDDDVAAILRQSRKAIVPDGRLLIVESVLPDVVDEGAEPFAYLNDLHMLVNFGGRERTLAELEHLCEHNGFIRTTTIPLLPPAMIAGIEARPC